MAAGNRAILVKDEQLETWKTNNNPRPVNANKRKKWNLNKTDINSPRVGEVLTAQKDGGGCVKVLTLRWSPRP